MIPPTRQRDKSDSQRQEGEGWLPGGLEREEEGHCLMGTKFQFRKIKRSGDGGGDGCTTMRI